MVKGWKKDKVGWYPIKGMGWIYLYPKKLFRGKENQVVLSISKTGGSNPKDRKNLGFKTKKDAIAFAIKYMNKNKHEIGGKNRK